MPAVYEQLVLDSDLFKGDIYDYIIGLPIDGPGANRHLNSRIKRSFITLLGTLCYNDPTQISRVIENKVLDRMIDMIMKCMPVDQMTIPILIEFVRMITIHEKGKDIIKRKGLFRLIMEPVVQEGKPNYESNLSMVIQSCSIPANNPL